MDSFGTRHLALIAVLALAACSDDGGSSSADDGFGNLLGSADANATIAPGAEPAPPSAPDVPANGAEPDVPTTGSVLIDADGDGFPDAFGDDAVDVDLDDDGIPDFVEDGGLGGADAEAPVPIDADGDGVPDLVPGADGPPIDPVTLAGLWDATFRTDAGRDVVYVEFTPERTFFVHDFLGDEAAANTSASANCYRSAGGTIVALGGEFYRVVAPGGTIDFIARLEGGGLSFALVDAVLGVTRPELLPPVLGVSPTDLAPCA